MHGGILRRAGRGRGWFICNRPSIPSRCDVFILAFLGPAADQDDETRSIPPKIDAVTGAKINSVFEHARADALGIRQVSPLNAGSER